MTVQSVWSPSSDVVGLEQMPRTSGTVTAGGTAGVAMKFTSTYACSVDKVWLPLSQARRGVCVEILSSLTPTGAAETSYVPEADEYVANTENESAGTSNLYQSIDSDGGAVYQSGDWLANSNSGAGGRSFYLARRSSSMAVTGRVRDLGIHIWTARQLDGSVGSETSHDSLPLLWMLNAGVDTRLAGEASPLPGVYNDETFRTVACPAVQTTRTQPGLPWELATVNAFDGAGYGFGWYSNVPTGASDIFFVGDMTLSARTYTENRMGQVYGAEPYPVSDRWVPYSLEASASLSAATDYWLHVWFHDPAGAWSSQEVPWIGCDPSNSFTGQVVQTALEGTNGIVTGSATVAAAGWIPAVFELDALTSVSAATSGATATFTKTSHGLNVGQIVEVSGYTSETDYNGVHEIHGATADTFACELDASPGGGDTGGTATPYSAESQALTDVVALDVDRDNTAETTLTPTAVKVTALCRFQTRWQGTRPTAPLQVRVGSATAGGGTEHATATVERTAEVTSAWSTAAVRLDTAWTTAAATTAYVYFTSEAAAGQGWEVLAVDAPTAGLTPAVELGWTGTRDDAGQDAVTDDTSADLPVQFVVPPTAPADVTATGTAQTTVERP